MNTVHVEYDEVVVGRGDGKKAGITDYVSQLDPETERLQGRLLEVLTIPDLDRKKARQ